MHIRVVRFTDVRPDWVDEVKKRIAEAGGPPEGVISTGVKFLYDEDQKTVVVLQYFDSVEDMETSEKVLEAMDASDTPGTRSSVDRCIIAAEANG